MNFQCNLDVIAFRSRGDIVFPKMVDMGDRNRFLRGDGERWRRLIKSLMKRSVDKGRNDKCRFGWTGVSARKRVLGGGKEVQRL